MSDEDVADKIFGHANDKKKALYANDLKEYAKAVTKMIRGISGRTTSLKEPSTARTLTILSRWRQEPS